MSKLEMQNTSMVEHVNRLRVEIFVEVTAKRL